MLIPRYNNFEVRLPELVIPHWLHDLYVDILRDADLLKVYAGSPASCISESLVGVHLPGIHMKLTEQTVKDMQGTGSIVRYWPKGMNNMRVLDDNEMALTFRHIDGFHNYYMLRQAITYMSDDNAQAAQGEVYKSIGNLVVTTQLSPNWSIKDIYQDVVYGALDGNEFAYASQASENTFTVRCKFTYYYSEYYCKGQCVSKRMFNHNAGN